jgi:hypothetical protein
LPYGTTARIQLTRGKKQGDLISPLLFELPFNVFLLALEATSVGLVRLFHKPRVGRGFADDVAIISSSKQQMQTRLTTTAQFCRWSGMRVKVTKSVLSAYDFRDRTEADVTGILYEGHALQHLPPEEAFPYLGIRSSLTGCFRAEKEHVMTSVRELREQVAHHKYNLDQMVDAMHMVPRLVFAIRLRLSHGQTPNSTDCIRGGSPLPKRRGDCPHPSRLPPSSCHPLRVDLQSRTLGCT